MGALGVFLTGTDTGVGKTHAAVRLARSLVEAQLRVAAMKPVAAGAHSSAAGPRNEDALALVAAANVSADYALINPYCLPAAVSPHIAAAEAGVRIALEPIQRAYAGLAARADAVIVEGAGGWLAPIDGSRTMADVAEALGLPVILVVGLRLGCLNHAALSAGAIRASRVPLAGWIANAIDPHFDRVADNLQMLARLLGGAPLLTLPWSPDPGTAPEGSAASLGAAADSGIGSVTPDAPERARQLLARLRAACAVRFG